MVFYRDDAGGDPVRIRQCLLFIAIQVFSTASLYLVHLTLFEVSCADLDVARILRLLGGTDMKRKSQP
ncbi:hypothetical protein F444_02868, partial [Phytophthora nicotianae P1976]